MKIRSIGACIFGALILLLGGVPAGATTVDQTTFHGYGADAIFRSVEAGQVIDVDVSLVTGRGVPLGASADLLEQYPLPLVVVTIVRSDETTGDESFNAAGIKSLEPSEFTLDQARLSSASVDATLDVYDSVSESTFEVDLDVVWEAWGRYSVSRGGSTVPSEQVVRAVPEKVREFMTAAGTVTLGGTNLTPEPTNGGYIMKTNQVSITITR
jgi:hypothetical protein